MTQKIQCLFGLIVAFLALLSPVATQAASFNCAKVSTKVEKMICADPELSRLDEELAQAYSEALKKNLDAEAFKQQQLEWIKNQSHCKDTVCLKDLYQQRLADLKQNPPVFATIFPPDIAEFDVDCGKAQSKVGKIICRQAGDHFESLVAKMHKEMCNTLQWTLMRSKNKQVVIDGQRQWQKQKRDACTDGLCLAEAYPLRTKELLAMSGRPNECYVPQPILDSDGNVKPIEPVCQAMEENLNQFCDQPPMVCELKVAPEFRQQITFPNWTPLDPEKNRELIEEFLRTPWQVESKQYEIEEKIWQEEKPKIENALATKSLSFSKSELDLYNLGKAQAAYRIDYGTCYRDNSHLNDKNAWGVPLRSAPIKIQYGPEIIGYILKQSFDFVSERSPLLGEVIIYGGKTYSYGMSGYSKPDSSVSENWLYINHHASWINPVNNKVTLTMSNTCRFDYRPIQGGEK